MGDRQDLRLNIKSSIFCLLNKVLEENNIHKSTFIQQAMIEKMMFSKAFRNEVISALEQNRDIDYYDALSAFIIRYLMPADKPRNISLALHGHNWRAQPDNPLSTIIPVQGAVSVGGAYNIELENGASEYPGDYLYRSGSLKWDVESGMWGIFRVLRKGVRYCCSCVFRSIGNWWEKKWYDK